MKRAMVVVMLLGLSAFACDVTVAAVGLTMYVHGATKVDDAEEELCARGAYPGDSGCPMPSTRITQAELDRLNAKGARGETIAQIGVVTTGVAVAVAGFALYKGFIKPKRENVIVAPTVTHDSAGATVLLRW